MHSKQHHGNPHEKPALVLSFSRFRTSVFKTVCRRALSKGMRLSLLVLLALYSNWVLAAPDAKCGAPPAVTNERVRGEVQVEATTISKLLGALGFGAAYEKSREDIFSKYGESNAARADQYLYFLLCTIVDQSTTLTDEQKIEAIFKMRSVMSGAPIPSPRPGAETVPSNRPPPNTALLKSNPAQAAEQFVRLAFSPSSTADDIIGLLHVPFCAERDIILSSADDLRTYLESFDSDRDIGKYIVSVVGTQIINQIDVGDLSWISRDYKAKQMIGRCLQNDIVSPSDHMVTICVRMVDLKKEVLTDVIVDKKSRLIKLFAVSANRCSL